jgi:hypothetical protein
MLFLLLRLCMMTCQQLRDFLEETAGTWLNLCVCVLHLHFCLHAHLCSFMLEGSEWVGGLAI